MAGPLGSSAEAELVERAKARSPEAWTAIYGEHYPAIYRYVHARVFDSDAADDLAAAVFVEAIKAIGSYRYRGQPLLAWLYTIARNVVSSYQRKLLRQRIQSFAFGHLSARERPGRSSDDGVDPAAEPIDVAQRMDLKEALARLPQTQREVLVLKFFVGMDAKEIGAMIGKDAAAVYSLQARALITLRGRLS